MELVQINECIHEARGMKVILDMDLVRIYDVETRVLKQAVRRNIDRFPGDFMFELTEDEMTNLTSQFLTLSWGGQRYKSFAFTE
jgi:hypothetical protein